MSIARRWVPVAHPDLGGREAEYVADCMSSEWISAGGPYNQRFEAAFAEFCGTQYAATCSNGTVALHLALVAAGIGPGDEVIVPTLTYVATVNAVRYCGAVPVFVDSDPATMNMDPEDVGRRVTERTRAIIVVHLYGHPADMDPINEIARNHGLMVIEDAAEAHGAEYKGRRCGSLGDLSTFSFFGNKIITTGEGGMVLTDSADLIAKVELYRGQGMDPDRRYWFPVIGFNYRMTNLQAAIGLAQVERIEALLEARQRVAQWYASHLAPLEGPLVLPVPRPWAHHAYWMYTVVLRDSDAEERDRLMAALAQAGFETRPVFHPVHTLPPYNVGEHFPVAERLGATGINLPSHPALREEHVAAVAAEIGAFLGRR